MSTIKTFYDLKVWQKAHILVLEVYRLTKNFPDDEKYALSVQIRRAVVSISSNIVEGFNRSSVKDSLHFYNFAKGSLEEVKCQLLITKDLHYISLEAYRHTLGLAEEVSKMLSSWTKSQTHNSKE